MEDIETRMALAKVKQRRKLAESADWNDRNAKLEQETVSAQRLDFDVGGNGSSLYNLDFNKIRKVKLDSKILAHNRILPALQDEAAVAAYKMLRTRVVQRMRANGWRTLAVSSMVPNEGKTLTATNLAISLASNVDQQVFLIDLDLRQPSLQSYLGLKTRYSLADYLDSNVPLESVLLSPGIDRLWVLPNHRTYHNSSEILASPQMARLVAELRGDDSNRLLIFDLPPILSADDLLAFSPCVDAILLVVCEGRTRRTDIAVAKDLLKYVNLAGVVVNRSSERKSGLYYPY